MLKKHTSHYNRNNKNENRSWTAWNLARICSSLVVRAPKVASSTAAARHAAAVRWGGTARSRIARWVITNLWATAIGAAATIGSARTAWVLCSHFFLSAMWFLLNQNCWILSWYVLERSRSSSFLFLGMAAYSIDR